MTEVSRKIEKIRELLTQKKATGLRLRGVDWFAWATGGGDSSVIFSSEIGVAEVFVTLAAAHVLTTEIERERMAVEQVPSEYEIVSFPWAQEGAFEDFVRAHSKCAAVISDRPEAIETKMDEDWMSLKLHLSSRELSRYQELGLDAARAATETLRAATPEMTEQELAGLAARSLWAKGIHPLLTLVGGESRVSRHRHPVAGGARVGGHGMLVICGRRHGLFANLTRHVYFRAPTPEERARARDVALVEAEAFNATEDLRPLPDIYRRIKARYSVLGFPNEIEKHHQGGPTGYLAREDIAKPVGTKGIVTDCNMAFAWNPSLPGAKIEDTVFLAADRRLINLTFDPQWPSFECEGRVRPDLLIRA